MKAGMFLIMATCLMALGGCASLRYSMALSQYSDRIIMRGDPGYHEVLSYFKEHHSGANSWLRSHSPLMLVPISNYRRLGFCLLAYEDDSVGMTFWSDGDMYESSFDLCWSEIEKEADAKWFALRTQRKEEERKRQIAEEEKAMKDRRIVSMKELIGIDAGMQIRSVMSDNGILPQAVGQTSYYRFPIGKQYRDGLIPGLRAFDGWKIVEIGVDSRMGDFVSVNMTRQPEWNASEELIAATLHSLKAKLHTTIDPTYSYHNWSVPVREWRWPVLSIADGRSLSVALMMKHFTGYFMAEIEITDVTTSCLPKVDPSVPKVVDRGIPEKCVQDNPSEDPLSKERCRELYDRLKKHLVVVKSETGVASGFVVRDGLKSWVYTNEHVIRGAHDKPTMVGLDGAPLSLSSFELAKDCDIVRFEVDNRTDGLEIGNGNCGVDTKIVVFGNSDGADVITSITGTVLGVGPSLLEVSAQFVQGNSGSPVIAYDGTVIGVATFVTKGDKRASWVKQNTRFNDVRRFAYRIDNVVWKPMDWELYTTIVNR